MEVPPKIKSYCYKKEYDLKAAFLSQNTLNGSPDATDSLIYKNGISICGHEDQIKLE